MIPTASLLTHSATPELYPLSLHDALPISACADAEGQGDAALAAAHAKAIAGDAYRFITAHAVQIHGGIGFTWEQDRKSTRLNSSHSSTSYAVFCLNKKRNRTRQRGRVAMR